MSESKGHPPFSRPSPITAAEFDGKVEAGEDVDEYLDWSSAVVIEPGQLSPVQQIAMEAEAQSPATSNLMAPEPQHPFSISLPSWAFELLQQDAGRHGVTHEHLAQLFILQRLDKLRTKP